MDARMRTYVECPDGWGATQILYGQLLKLGYRVEAALELAPSTTCGSLATACWSSRADRMLAMSDIVRDDRQALAESGAPAVITGTWPMMHVKPDGGPLIRVGKPEADDPTADGEDWEITLTDCTLSGQLTIRGQGKVFFDGAQAYLASL